MWNYQCTELNSTGMEGVNVESLIAAQGIQLEKTPLPPHSDASLPHADSHVLDPPPAVNPWSFYPCFDRRVVVSRFKELGRGNTPKQKPSQQPYNTQSTPPTLTQPCCPLHRLPPMHNATNRTLINLIAVTTLFPLRRKGIVKLMAGRKIK